MSAGADHEAVMGDANPAPLIARPKLTLPADEAAFLAEVYGKSQRILEYGSGGSTILGGENPQATVYSVESDAAWVKMMRGWFAQNPPKGKVVLHHADIGPTRDWGYPVGEGAIKRWPDYPNSIWQRRRFRQPDVALIDGRFRLACFLTCLFRTTQPMMVLWDDYKDRPAYHKIEELIKPVEMIGRMARFAVAPTALPPVHFGWVINAFLQPA